MTYETAFKKLKEKFENVNSEKLSDMAIQFTLSDEDCGGTFYAETRSGKLDVQPYDYKDNDAVVDITRTALTKILDGKLSIENAIESGDLTVKGDLEKIKSVVDAIEAPVKEAPIKKAPAKTTAANKNETKAEAKTEEIPVKAKRTCVRKTAAKKTETEAKETKTTAAKKTAATKAPAKKTTK